MSYIQKDEPFVWHVEALFQEEGLPETNKSIISHSLFQDQTKSYKNSKYKYKKWLSAVF